MEGKLSSNIEDYLETIAILSSDNPIVRMRDISKRMDVSMASVNKALKVLSKNGLIMHEKYGYIDLTEKGKSIGKMIYDSHKALIEFFTRILGIPAKIAEEDACRVEHDISRFTMNRLISLIQFIDSSGKDRKSLVESFKRYLRR